MLLLQVMSPMRKGPAGVNQLNISLQALLNPPAPRKAGTAIAEREMLDGCCTLCLVQGGDSGIAVAAGHVSNA